MLSGMKKGLLLLTMLVVCVTLCVARPDKNTSRDSIAAHRLATVRYYEQQLALLVQGQSLPLPDSMAIPCPYYYKMIAMPTLYTEPIHDAMSISWQPQSVTRPDLLPSFGHQ